MFSDRSYSGCEIGNRKQGSTQDMKVIILTGHHEESDLNAADVLRR